MGRYTDMLERLKPQHLDFSRAVYAALREADEDYARNEAAFKSRFYCLVLPEKGPPMLFPVTQESVSYHYDMAEDDPVENPYRYLEDDGWLSVVTCGNFHRYADDMADDSQLVYGASDLIAGGKVVGTVYHTDH